MKEAERCKKEVNKRDEENGKVKIFPSVAPFQLEEETLPSVSMCPFARGAISLSSSLTFLLTPAQAPTLRVMLRNSCLTSWPEPAIAPRDAQK